MKILVPPVVQKMFPGPAEVEKVKKLRYAYNLENMPYIIPKWKWNSVVKKVAQEAKYWRPIEDFTYDPQKQETSKETGFITNELLEFYSMRDDIVEKQPLINVFATRKFISKMSTKPWIV